MVVVEPISVLNLYTVLYWVYSLIVRPHKTVIEMSLTFSFEGEHTASDLVLTSYILLRLLIHDPNYVYVDCVVVAVFLCSESLPVAAVCVDQ